jgi:hypothetical protein
VRPGLDEIDSQTESEIESESNIEDSNLAAGTRSRTGSLLTDDEKRTGFLNVAPPPSGSRQRSKSPSICICAPSSGSTDSVYLDTVEGTESPNSEPEMSLTLTEEGKAVIDTANKIAAALDQQQAGQPEQKKSVEPIDPTLAAVVNLGVIPVEYGSAIGDLTIAEIIRLQNTAEFKIPSNKRVKSRKVVRLI